MRLSRCTQITESVCEVWETALKSRILERLCIQIADRVARRVRHTKWVSPMGMRLRPTPIALQELIENGSAQAELNCRPGYVVYAKSGIFG